MNRELKFRIWDKISKTLIYDNLSPFWFHIPRAINGQDEIEGESNLISLSEILAHPDFVAQQYTGLQDKNGKEIFEGDIIEHTFSKTTDDETSIHFGSKLNGSVSFCNHLCAYILTIISDDRHNGDTFQLMNHAPSKKIIGNVFENPELIKNDE
jgi:uncharacterized phage protein (TIGR01671 family)